MVHTIQINEQANAVKLTFWWTAIHSLTSGLQVGSAKHNNSFIIKTIKLYYDLLHYAKQCNIMQP